MNKEQGLRSNQGKTQWSFVDFQSFIPMVNVLKYGAHKYSNFEDKKGNRILGKDVLIEKINELKLISTGKDNWKKGFPVTDLCDSLLRHIFELLEGKDIDEESGLPIIGHIQCNVMFLEHTLRNHPEFDNRPKKELQIKEECIKFIKSLNDIPFEITKNKE